jgi:hypothetical protein
MPPGGDQHLLLCSSPSSTVGISRWLLSWPGLLLGLADGAPQALVGAAAWWVEGCLDGLLLLLLLVREVPEVAL